MPSYGLSSTLERVLRSARDVAVEQGAATLESDHLAQAVLREPDSAAAIVIDQLTPDRAALVQESNTRSAAAAPVQAADEIPYSVEAKGALAQLMMEARRLRHTCFCTAHLLLALLSRESGATTRKLHAVGVNLAAARDVAGRLTAEQLTEDG
jgi:ATP-dependent Clp protease ATP-binding subunit ClpA